MPQTDSCSATSSVSSKFLTEKNNNLKFVIREARDIVLLLLLYVHKIVIGWAGFLHF